MSNYDPSIGGQLLNEGVGRYKLIGYVKDSNVEYSKGDYYVLVDTQYPESDNINRWYEQAVKYNTEKDGSGMGVYPGKEITKFITLLPEYENSYYAHAIFGEPKEVKEQKSRELFNTIEQDNDIAILKHNSERVITDGMIRVGMTPNDYSTSDFKSTGIPRAYFWGSEGGNDVSNYRANYQYICHLPIAEIYNMDANVEQWNIDDVIKNGYTAIAYYMGNNKANGTVVVSFKDLPIKNMRKL